MIKLNKSQKNILIGILCTIVLLMAVGYAAFASTLNIKGTTKVDSSWDIEITEITPSATATNIGTESEPIYDKTGSISTSISDGTSATFNANLKNPGDVLTYTVRVENKGTVDAILEQIDTTYNNSDILVMNVSGIAENETLSTGAVKTFTVTVTYSNDVKSQPKSGTSASLGLTLLYKQYTGKDSSSGSSGSGGSTTPSVIYTWDSGTEYGTTDYKDLDSYATDYKDLNKTFFIKNHVGSDGILESGELCYIYNESEAPLCFKAPAFYDDNVTTIQTFQSNPNSNGLSCSYDDSNKTFRCEKDGVYNFWISSYPADNEYSWVELADYNINEYCCIYKDRSYCGYYENYGW